MIKLLPLAWLCLHLALASSHAIRGDEGPLHLTPYIESGKVEEAQQLAQVKSDTLEKVVKVNSYSGLLTVDKATDSRLFFWYFPSERKPSEVPLLLWLNGWSTPSTYGVFLQTGPYDLSSETLAERDVSWQKEYNVLYIDSPVGVGYSSTNSSQGYATTIQDVGKNLEEALSQFLKLFPDLGGRELYLTSLSLGGKYMPSLAHRIYKKPEFNLKGIFLGNPVLDIGIQMTYEDYLYQLGFIDSHQKVDLIKQQDKLKALMTSNDYYKFNEFSDNFWLVSNSYLVNITGLDNVFDYEDNVVEWRYQYAFMDREDIKKDLHVNGVKFDFGTEAMRRFGQGIATSTLGLLGEMADSVDMMFYAGQNDLSITYPKMVEALQTMEWSGKEKYADAPRTRLYKEDGHHVWGYMRRCGTVSDVMVRKAGHSAVTSQPHHVRQLLHLFTNYTRFQ